MSTTTEQGVRAHIGTERSISLRQLTKNAYVSLEEDREYVARLEIRHDSMTWRYGVDDDRRVTFLDARDTNGHRVDVAEPDWMYDVFNQIGVRDR